MIEGDSLNIPVQRNLGQGFWSGPVNIIYNFEVINDPNTTVDLASDADFQVVKDGVVELAEFQDNFNITLNTFTDLIDEPVEFLRLTFDIIENDSKTGIDVYPRGGNDEFDHAYISIFKPTPSPTATATITPTVTVSLTPTKSPTPTLTPTVSPTPFPTPTLSPQPSFTPTASASTIVSSTPEPTRTTTPTITPTITPTPTPSMSPNFIIDQTLEVSFGSYNYTYSEYESIHENNDLVFDLHRKTGERYYTGAFIGHIFLEELWPDIAWFSNVHTGEFGEFDLKRDANNNIIRPFFFPENEDTIQVAMNITGELHVVSDDKSESLEKFDLHLGEYLIPSLDPYETGDMLHSNNHLENSLAITQEEFRLFDRFPTIEGFRKTSYQEGLGYRVDTNTGAHSFLIMEDLEVYWNIIIENVDGQLSNANSELYKVETSSSGIRDTSQNVDIRSINEVPHFRVQDFSFNTGNFYEHNVLVTFPDSKANPTKIVYNGITGDISHVESTIQNDFGDRYFIFDFDDPQNDDSLSSIYKSISTRGKHSFTLLLTGAFDE